MEPFDVAVPFRVLEVNRVPLSVVSVKFSSRLPEGSRSSKRCERFHSTIKAQANPVRKAPRHDLCSAASMSLGEVVEQAVRQVGQVPRVVEHHAITTEVSKRTGNSVLVAVGFAPPNLLVRHQAVSSYKSVCKLLDPKRLVGANGFEPSTSWSRTRFRNAMNFIELCRTQLLLAEPPAPYFESGLKPVERRGFDGHRSVCSARDLRRRAGNTWGSNWRNVRVGGPHFVLDSSELM